MHKSLFALRSHGNQIECIFCSFFVCAKKCVLINCTMQYHRHRYASASTEYPIICSFVFSIFNCYYHPISAYRFAFDGREEEKRNSPVSQSVPRTTQFEWIELEQKRWNLSVSLVQCNSESQIGFHSFIWHFPFCFNSILTCHFRMCSSAWISTLAVRRHALISLEHCFHY